MCMSSPSAPAPPPPPPPPPAPIQPTKLSAQVQASRAGANNRAKAAGVRRDTIITSKQGLVDENPNAPKTLLGA
jgi:hypothetical protein